MTHHQMTKGMLQMLAVSGLVCAAAPASASSVGAYNGDWSVVIMTHKGDCDRAYRYPLRITNGLVSYGGSAGFSVSGTVARDGAVTVKVSRDSQSAAGTGRLRETSGNGKWSGGPCAGTWSAERR